MSQKGAKKLFSSNPEWQNKKKIKNLKNTKKFKNTKKTKKYVVSVG